MKSNITYPLTSRCQDFMYKELEFYDCKPARLALSVPVAIADVALETLKIPLRAIESAASAALNLIGAAFYQNYSLKDALWNAENAFVNTVAIPVVIVFAPLKLLCQLFEVLKNETLQNSIAVQSIHTYSEWHRSTDLELNLA